MTWFTATSATVLNGGIIVSINNGDDIEIAQVAGGLIVGTNPPVEIKRTYLDGLGDKKIELRSAWPYASQTAQPAVAFPTDADLAEATKVLRQLIDGFAIASQVEAEDGVDNLKTMTPLRTKQAILKQTEDLISSSGIISAMSQAQFEAIRGQNKERYAASGWVNFGNHESGKQVNECKSGLYTALTTPNTLLIGKAGGVGGSKTDYASVHIDGVIFNLTNQFVLTMPVPPTYSLPERMDMYGVESERVEISAASPNAYQGGLRGVGAAVNLFSATDQQKKDFFSQNSNTTYIGADSKIYQHQLYAISFSGTNETEPTPTEQGYALNTFGDLWLKGNKKLLYSGNLLRLNDGGYHPSFNPLGAAKFVGDKFWYTSTVSIASRADCFSAAKLLTGSGRISSGKSGRRDGRYSDVIYDGGPGGVCNDSRYTSTPVCLQDFFIADSQIKNSVYNGCERMLFSLAFKSVDLALSGAWNTIGFTADSPESRGIVNDRIAIQNINGTYSWHRITAVSSSSYTFMPSITTNKPATPHAVVCMSKALSFGMKFLQTDVIGLPPNILKNVTLKNGWLGGFINQIPNGSNSNWEFTYPTSAAMVSVLKDEVEAGIFNLFSYPVTANSISGYPFPSASVVILQYESTSRTTVPSDVLSVYGGGLGIGTIYSSSFYSQDAGSTLCNSLLGLPLYDNNFNNFSLTNSLESYGMDGFAITPSASRAPKHSALNLVATSRGSTAFKALSLCVLKDKKLYVQYLFTSLSYTAGTGWGDNSRQLVANKFAVTVDANNKPVFYGCAVSMIPIGWVKL